MIDDKIIMAIVGIFGGLITFLQKVLWTQGKNNYGMIVKLIDRWNRSDEASDRRHEDMMKEIADLTDKVSYLSGKMSSK